MPQLVPLAARRAGEALLAGVAVDGDRAAGLGAVARIGVDAQLAVRRARERAAATRSPCRRRCAAPKSHCSPASTTPLPHIAPPALARAVVTGAVRAAHLAVLGRVGDGLADVLRRALLLVDTPARAAQSVAAFTHSQWQSALQPSVLTACRSPRRGSTMPLPHVGCVHTPVLQKPVVPQNVLSASGVPAAQTCVAVVARALARARVGGRAVAVRVRSRRSRTCSRSRSRRRRSEFASSHSSVPVTKPSPHTPSTHAAFLQIMSVPHVVPSSSRVPGLQA